jgi:hypothetical protein
MVRQGLFGALLLFGAAVCLVQGGPPKPQEQNPPATVPADAQAVDKVVAELQRIGELIRQLDSDKFAVRQKASEELLRLGSAAVAPLRKLVASNPNLELARRAEMLLAQIPKDLGKKMTAGEICDRLARGIDLSNGIDANTSLGDALQHLSEKSGVPLLIDTTAFASIGIAKAEESVVQLPKMNHVRLDQALRMLLAQVKGDAYCGDFLVRAGHVEITTTYHVLSGTLGIEPAALAASMDDDSQPPKTEPPRVLKVVHVNVDKRSLQEALKELAAAANVTIVVDPRVGDKAKTAVTALMPNVFVDTALLLLCDMADVQAFQTDTVFYVTTRENAARLEAKRKPRRIEPPKEMAPPNRGA